jgi:hypothetical protein
MKANVTNAAEAGSKWTRRAGSASEEYRRGVSGAGARWAAAAAAGAQNFAAGVQAAITQNRFQKGVQKAGAGKYEANASKLGGERFASGVANAEGAYAAGVQPFLSAIAGVDLPARGPVGSEQNYGRVAAIGKALRQLKTSR